LPVPDISFYSLKCKSTYDSPNNLWEENIHRERNPIVNLGFIEITFLRPRDGSACSHLLDDPRICELIMMNIILEVFKLFQTEEEVLFPRFGSTSYQLLPAVRPRKLTDVKLNTILTGLMEWVIRMSQSFPVE